MMTYLLIAIGISTCGFIIFFAARVRSSQMSRDEEERAGLRLFPEIKYTRFGRNKAADNIGCHSRNQQNTYIYFSGMALH